MSNAADLHKQEIYRRRSGSVQRRSGRILIAIFIRNSVQIAEHSKPVRPLSFPFLAAILRDNAAQSIDIRGLQLIAPLAETLPRIPNGAN